VLLGLGVAAGAAALLLRRRERRDRTVIGGDVKERTARLAAREDQIVQNQMSSVINVKPGLFRSLTLRTVLAFIDLAARVEAVEGRLAGIPSIHFARWVIVDDGRRLVFFSNFDGSWENYLGDFIDRGDQSREVIDFLLDQYIPGFDIVHLTGNHEEIMLAFMEDPSFGPNWLANGGGATLHSYGIGGTKRGSKDRFDIQRESLKQALPVVHFDFLRGLDLWHIEGDYMFVHAGVRPGRDAEEQYRTDVLWIRDEFLSSDADHGKCIVHGHTISADVQFRHNRIGIDTGAYATGKLSCLVLEGREQRVIQT